MATPRQNIVVGPTGAIMATGATGAGTSNVNVGTGVTNGVAQAAALGSIIGVTFSVLGAVVLLGLAAALGSSPDFGFRRRNKNRLSYDYDGWYDHLDEDDKEDTRDWRSYNFDPYRHKRDISDDSLDEIYDMVGILDVNNCGMKFLCEIYAKNRTARTPWENTVQQFVGDELGDVNSQSDREFRALYHTSAILGRQGENCTSLYANCPFDQEQILQSLQGLDINLGPTLIQQPLTSLLA